MAAGLKTYLKRFRKTWDVAHLRQLVEWLRERKDPRRRSLDQKLRRYDKQTAGWVNAGVRRKVGRGRFAPHEQIARWFYNYLVPEVYRLFNPKWNYHQLRPEARKAGLAIGAAMMITGRVAKANHDVLFEGKLEPRLRSSDVVGMIDACKTNPERMPILADALLDAGCEDEELIDYCMNKGKQANAGR